MLNEEFKKRLLEKINEPEDYKSEALNRIIFATITFPGPEEWALLGRRDINARAIAALDKTLGEALDELKAGRYQTAKSLGRVVYNRMENLAVKYPSCGITDSEGMCAAAQFFADNWNPALYEIIREGGCDWASWWDPDFESRLETFESQELE